MEGLKRAPQRTPSFSVHLQRLRIFNTIAPVVFIVSCYNLSAVLREAALSNGASMVKVGLPGLGLLASLTYLFGFFGIPAACEGAAEMDDLAKPKGVSSAKRTASSRKARSSHHNVTKPAARTVAKSAGETVIVVGAGTAGATAAVVLARRGFKVLMIERDMTEQDRIVGELLQPGGLRALERLGLDDCAKAGIDSVPVDGYVVLTADSKGSDMQQIHLNYPGHDPKTLAEYFGVLPDDVSTSAEAAPQGRGFHNGRFVQELRKKMLLEPNVTVVVGVVSKLLEEKGKVVGVQYKVDSEQEGGEKVVKTAYAPVTIVADGLWSGLRKEVDAAAKPKQMSSFVGLILQHPPMQSQVPFRGRGHVVLGDPSPILLYQISSTETRVLVDIHGPMPSASTGELQEYLKSKTMPQLPEGVREAFDRAVDSGNIKSMPNRAMPTASIDKDGVMLLGDALNMRHPLTGGGMTVAIRDVEAMADLLSDIDITDSRHVCRAKAAFREQRKQYASTINVLANALHAVFSTPGNDPTRKDLREACFDYLSLGGCYAAGPIGLLSGLTPRPSILALHFFMVAGYGIKTYLLPFPTPKNLVRMYRILHVACKIIMPLFEQEKSTVLSNFLIRTVVDMLFPWRDGI